LGSRMLPMLVVGLLQAASASAAPQPTGPEGSVVLVCRVTARGELENCRVDSEEPVGQGFGAAAMEMAKEFKLRPRTRDGQKVEGGTIRIPMKFKLPKQP